MNYNEKILTLSLKEMLDLWKTRLNITPIRRDCVIEREDGIDLDSYLKLRIDEWYAGLLREAPEGWLPIKDVADTINFKISPNNVVRIAGSEELVRPVKVKMSSWKRALNLFHNPESFMAQLQYSEYTCGGTESPVGIIMPTEILMYSAGSSDDTIETAIFVTRPAAGFYSFGESALSTLPTKL